MQAKGGLAGAAVVAAALIMVGCQPLANIGEKGNPAGQRYIKLAINVPVQGRAISVTDFTVTSLAIAVRDPDGVGVYSDTWDASEGDTTEMIPVEKTGDYMITVTHHGERDGQRVEASEFRTFTIGAMVITEIEIVPGSIGVIHLQGGDTQPTANGTLTLHLTGVAAPDGTSVLVGVYAAGADPGADPLAGLLAVAGGPLAGGSLDSTATINGTFDTWVGTGGSSCDVYTWLDMNNNVDTVMYPEPGIDRQLVYFPVTVEINGNVDLYFTGADIIPVP